MPTISDCSLLHLFDLDVSDGSDSLNSPDVNFTLREDFLLYLDLYNFVLLNESLVGSLIRIHTCRHVFISVMYYTIILLC